MNVFVFTLYYILEINVLSVKNIQKSLTNVNHFSILNKYSRVVLPDCPVPSCINWKEYNYPCNIDTKSCFYY